MGKHQRRKGRAYEQLIARFYRELLGLDFDEVKRGSQSRDGSDASDVIVPGLSVECKHHKRCPNIFNAMEQAIESADEGDTPVVHVRVDRRGDLVVLRLEDWKRIVKGGFLN